MPLRDTINVENVNATNLAGTNVTAQNLTVYFGVQSGHAGMLGQPILYAGTGVPSFSAPSGSIFLSYSNGIYQNTSSGGTSGTSWTQMAVNSGLGTVTSVTGSDNLDASPTTGDVHINLKNIPTEVFNVILDYGAVGNGSTDDSAAILNAVTAVNAAGGTLYFPAGYTYYYNSATAITLTGSVRVEGLGAILKGGSSTTNAFIFSNSITASAISNLPNIENFAAGAGLIIQTSTQVINCAQISGCLKGIVYDSHSTNNVLDNTVNVNFIASCEYGIVMTSDGTASGGFQGNITNVNFCTAASYGIAWLRQGSATSYVCTNNTYNVYAMDPIGATQNPSYGFYQDPAITAGIGQNNFDCRNFFGGNITGYAAFSAAVTAHQTNNDYVLDPAFTAYAHISSTGTGAVPYNSRVTTIGANNGYAMNMPIALRPVTASYTLFNGGAPALPNTIFVSATLASDLATGNTIYFYGYHWTLSGQTPISVTPYSATAYKVHVFIAQDATSFAGPDGNTAAYQFIIGIRALENVTSGTSINFVVKVGP